MSDLLQALISGGIQPADAIRIANAIKADIAAAPVAAAAVSTSATTVVNNYALPADKPTTFSGPIETQQAAVFSGDSQFSGPVTIGGEVMWGGMPRSPTPVSAVGAISVLNGELHFQPLEMAVLNDFGLGKPQRITLSSGGSTFALGSINASITPGEAMIPNTATFNPSTSPLTYVTTAVGSVSPGKTYSVLSTLSSITATTDVASYPTGFTLDPDSCTISVSSTGSITYVSKVELIKEPRTVIASLDTSPAATDTANLVTSGTIALAGPTRSFVSGATITATTVAVGAAGGVVLASISDPQ